MRWKVIVTLVLATAVPACRGVPEDATGPEIFAQECARCHGSELQGGIGPSLGRGSDASTRSDEFLVTTITRGRSPMPAFGEVLSQDQIGRLIEYLRVRQR